MWFRGEGDCHIRGGRADLVFVVKQIAHPLYERVGDDLWYVYGRGSLGETVEPTGRDTACGAVDSQHLSGNNANEAGERTRGELHGESGQREPDKESGLCRMESTPAESLFWCRLVPLFEGGWALAQSNTLAALLGFDRTGFGEAVVEDRGMPLRGEAVTQPSAPLAGAHFRTRGDLVVKFCISPPRRPRRVEVVGGGVLLPPLVLAVPTLYPYGNASALTLGGCGETHSLPSSARGLRRSCGADVDSTHESSSAMLLPPRALASVFRSAILPAVVMQAARAWIRRGAHRVRCAGGDGGGAHVGTANHPLVDITSGGCSCVASTSRVLCGVWVGITPGGTSPFRPGAAAEQVMASACSWMPQFRWSHIHLVGDVEEGLLADEVALLGESTIVVIEIGPTSLEASPVRASPTASTSNGIEACRYVVEAVPGVRVRAAPSVRAPTVGILRNGDQVQGSPPGPEDWVALSHGGYALAREAPRQAARHFPSHPVASPAGAGAAPPFETACPRPRETFLRLIDADDETDVDSEGECALGQIGDASAKAGPRLRIPSKSHRSERVPGSQIQTTAFDGHGAPESPCRAGQRKDSSRCAPPPRHATSSAARRLLGGVYGAAIHAAHCNGAVIVAIGDAVELLAQTAVPASTAAKDGRVSREPTRLWPQLAPYVVRMPREEAWRAGRRAAAWRELRTSVAQARLSAHDNGFSGVGLPPGCVAAVHTSDKFALRPALGSLWQPYGLPYI